MPALKFPPYMAASRNYYKPSWGFSAYRRLKNVLLVAEWVPERGALKDHTEAKGMVMTPEQVGGAGGGG